jgi:hypothetical protein
MVAGTFVDNLAKSVARFSKLVVSAAELSRHNHQQKLYAPAKAKA